MSEFEKLLNAQEKELEFLKYQYKLSDNYINRFREQNGRYPNEEEAKAYYSRLQQRRLKNAEANVWKTLDLIKKLRKD